mmetsp:Transcript_4434/g.5922  ORF Transcript_4434/g.5922 Transcript_4434/m.5922 type:complete len:260 (+) Transcript_4434:366-1145(+)
MLWTLRSSGTFSGLLGGYKRIINAVSREIGGHGEHLGVHKGLLSGLLLSLGLIYQSCLRLALIHDVKNLAILLFYLVTRRDTHQQPPQQRVTFLPDHERPFLVGCLGLIGGVVVLGHGDNRDEQVEHEDNQEYAGEEEDNPVVVVEVLGIAPVVGEVSKTRLERDLPHVHPLLEIGLERNVDVFVLHIAFGPLFDVHALTDGVPGVGECGDSRDEDRNEDYDRDQTVQDQTHDPAEGADLWQVGEDDCNPEEEGDPGLA